MRTLHELRTFLAMSDSVCFGSNEVRKALSVARERLLGGLNAEGYWEGRLSGSALSTAVAVFALAYIDGASHGKAVARGVDWLSSNINEDGGWGDTPESPSNLSTTLLGWSALSVGDGRGETLGRVEEYIAGEVGSLEAGGIAAAVVKSYGADRTFSAPILMVLALAGRLGAEPECWDLVPQLPFELAVLPRVVFKWLRLSVVSYAIPALVAVGMARHRRRPTANSVLRVFRGAAQKRALEVLRSLQPSNGGFLEATPLTAFVTLAMSAAGLGEHPVTASGVSFLVGGMRDDGSWPIDTNLATWVTTLSINALADCGAIEEFLTDKQREAVRSWLLGQQSRGRHPYTMARAGGWSWTDLPGGVPDGDDTSGALVALKKLGGIDDATRAAAVRGTEWLLALQNGDGGIPTFCRGWGRLPFDRSCAEITAHALQAFDAWRGEVGKKLAKRIDAAAARAVGYLRAAQREDGSFVPLWFGSQGSASGENPTYGTARVVGALGRVGSWRDGRLAGIVARGAAWLVSAQNEDGGWGGDVGVESSVEETGLAVWALAGAEGHGEAAARGATWLAGKLTGAAAIRPAPIGLYFASLWYWEELYGYIFAVAALGGA